MDKKPSHISCENVCTFGSGEKLILRTLFYVSALLGAYGIAKTSLVLAVAYVAYALISYFMLMRHTVCSRCPHLFVADDCLFVPASLVKNFVIPKKGALSTGELLIVLFAVLGTAGIPIYWLAADTTLLVIYLALNAGFTLGLVGRICKKCQVEVCPMNRNPLFKGQKG
ncbi:hypothetical protein GM415_10070 [Pseudodesulfovibrio cashew]|uniref:DUF4395 domain-containing protein n=1 Tax=Pseudodesulfovibrio cashew TaxID=2678688 RepID=A0A6I6JK19_9BACT|nr:hypothetical protein [Pseudodesulfovibrio cashew]QGY40457.1 hypothetical protein GM415_10070 [Pseudodesulfovibrio cashew]